MVLEERPVVKVIGVGKLGYDTMSKLSNNSWDGVELLTVDSGSYVEIGMKLQKTDMAIVLVDTNSQTTIDEALHVIEVAKEQEILTVAMVSGEPIPQLLLIAADAVITSQSKGNVNNNGIELSFSDGVKHFVECVSYQSIVSIDFWDMKHCLSNVGLTIMTRGRATGPNAATTAIMRAIDSMKDTINPTKIKSMIMHITGSVDSINMLDVNNASNYLCENIHPEAEVLWGIAEDNSMGYSIDVMLMGVE